jgi:carboxymethylenebutenolidase
VKKRMEENMFETNQYQGMLAETITLPGFQGDWMHAYLARPLGAGTYPGVVLVHHMPGWDDWYFEATRKFAANGFVALCPNLYERAGHGSPEDVAAKVRASGGIPDLQAVGDITGALIFMHSQPYLIGKIGVFGTCSGGRLAFLAACLSSGFSAVVDCWGGRVVMSPEELTANQPVSPLEYTARLSCPVLGIFGNEDQSPTPQQVDTLEAELVKHGKTYHFHRYPGAGHGFFYHHRPGYRQAQAVDGWQKVFAFLEQTLR